MLTVLTQNSRLPRERAFRRPDSVWFRLPALPVPGARRQVMLRPLMYNVVRVGDSLLSSALVAFVSRTNKSKIEIAAPSVPGRVQRLALFGPPILLEGEDAA